jgi:hypothetical protein
MSTHVVNSNYTLGELIEELTQLAKKYSPDTEVFVSCNGRRLERASKIVTYRKKKLKDPIICIE